MMSERRTPLKERRLVDDNPFQTKHKIARSPIPLQTKASDIKSEVKTVLANQQHKMLEQINNLENSCLNTRGECLETHSFPRQSKSQKLEEMMLQIKKVEEIISDERKKASKNETTDNTISLTKFDNKAEISSSSFKQGPFSDEPNIVLCQETSPRRESISFHRDIGTDLQLLPVEFKEYLKYFKSPIGPIQKTMSRAASETTEPTTKKVSQETTTPLSLSLYSSALSQFLSATSVPEENSILNSTDIVLSPNLSITSNLIDICAAPIDLKMSTKCISEHLKQKSMSVVNFDDKKCITATTEIDTLTAKDASTFEPFLEPTIDHDQVNTLTSTTISSTSATLVFSADGTVSIIPGKKTENEGNVLFVVHYIIL